MYTIYYIQYKQSVYDYRKYRLIFRERSYDRKPCYNLRVSLRVYFEYCGYCMQALMSFEIRNRACVLDGSYFLLGLGLGARVRLGLLRDYN